MIVDPSTPQPQALPTMGVRSSREIVDHLDNVLKSQPPEVQAAVDHAHGLMGMQSPAASVAPQSPAAPVDAIAAPATAPEPIDAAIGVSAPIAQSPRIESGSRSDMPDHQPLPRMSASAIESPVSASTDSVQPTPNPHMAELTRLHETGSGASQIKNPFLKTLATIGDVVGSGFFPQFSQFIPGTSARNERLIDREESQLGQEQKATKALDESEASDAGVVESGARTGKIEAETEAIPIESAERQAHAQSLLHPKAEGTVHEAKDGSLWVVHPDGTATAVAPGGKPLQAKDKTGGTVHSDAQGNMWLVGPDAVAIPITPKAPQAPSVATPPVNGAPVGGSPTAAPDNQLKAKTTDTDTADYKNYTKDKAEGFKGTFAQWQDHDANRKKSVTILNPNGLTNQTATLVTGLAKDFDNEQDVKNYSVIKEARSFVKSLGTGKGANATDDQGILYAFAKVMDPNSVVREGEYNTVQKYAQSWADNFGFKADRIFSNSPFLTEQARKQMKDTIDKRYSASEKNYKNTYNEFARRIDMATGTKNGKDYLTDHSKDETSGDGSSVPTPKTQAEYDALPPGTIYIDSDGVKKKKK